MAKYWNKPIIVDWIKKEITDTPKTGTIAWTEEFGNYLASDYVKNDDGAYIEFTDKYGKTKRKIVPKLTTNQIRKFFGEVKRIQSKSFNSETKIEFKLLKPKLAYAVGRSKKKEAKIHDFYHVFAPAIDYVETKDDFRRFIKIFEAVVAYHKAAEETKLILEN